MFGIGMQELIIILIIALVFIGPKRLPEIAKALGRGMAEFRKATNEMKETLAIDEDLKDIKETFTETIYDAYQPTKLPKQSNEKAEINKAEKSGDDLSSIEGTGRKTEKLEKQQNTEKEVSHKDITGHRESTNSVNKQ